MYHIGHVLNTPNPALQLEKIGLGAKLSTFEIFDLGEILGSRVVTYALHYDPTVKRSRSTIPLLRKMVATP